jgi:hypothetical protein
MPVDCATVTAVIALAVGFGGVGLGGLLTRRNERRSHAEGLLTQALNDAVAAIADVAVGGGSDTPAHSTHPPPLASRCAAHVRSWSLTVEDADPGHHTIMSSTWDGSPY